MVVNIGRGGATVYDQSMSFSAAESDRYSRHLRLREIGAPGQERLKAARVLIIGAGGLGSPAALYLAAAGVGTLGLLDFDCLESSNLQRQVLFDTDGIGQSKAQLARARLCALNPELRIMAHPVELCAANVESAFHGYDLIIDGSDRLATRYLVNDACVIYRKSLVAAAVYRFEGQAMTYVPERGPCYRCLFPRSEVGAAPSCAEVGVLGVVPGVMGTIQATEAIKLITGIGTPLIGRLLTYDALELRFSELRFERRADCAVCGERPSIRTPSDPLGFCSGEELARVQSITAAALAERLSRNPAAFTLIDVREPGEFAHGHLRGSVNRPLPAIEQQGMPAAVSGTLVFICRSGVRSRRAAALASRAGAAACLQLQGGLLAWRSEVDAALSLAD
jgi:adenylyltransferase/sulfurtransferase